MKTKIALALLAIAPIFSQNALLEAIPKLDLKPAAKEPKETVSPVKHFRYLRMGVSDTELKTNDVMPGIGIGYRISSGSHALDLSSSYNQREKRTDLGKERTYYFTLPKANYLFYTNSGSNTSLYAGGGVAWGGVHTQNDQFIGLIPNLALGLEMNRNAAWSSFIQIDVSQPAIAARQRGDLPKPFAELTLGAGF